MTTNPAGPTAQALQAARDAAAVEHHRRIGVVSDGQLGGEHYVFAYAHAGACAVWDMAVAEGRRQAAADIRTHANNILTMACKDAGIGPTADAAQQHPLVLGLEFAARVAEEAK